jgi:hypothetical protein
VTGIEQKALALVNEIELERGSTELTPHIMRRLIMDEALCRAIEAHEAFKQEVSDIVYAHVNATNETSADAWEKLKTLIINADKPDALVDVWGDLFIKSYNLDQFCDALEARGLEIRAKDE